MRTRERKITDAEYAEMLQINVSVDGPDVQITGCVPINTGSIAFSHS